VGIWALAIWSAPASLGNPTGLVLCIEDDGSMSIETPAEQAACHHRQELAATQAEFCAPAAGGCIDIPLSLNSAATLHRSNSVRVVSLERLAAGFLCPSLAQLGLPRSAPVFSGALDGRSPPSAALTSLRTIILLI